MSEKKARGRASIARLAPGEFTLAREFGFTEGEVCAEVCPVRPVPLDLTDATRPGARGQLGRGRTRACCEPDDDG